MVYLPQLASATYTPLQNLAACSLQECLGNPMPFFSTVFGARMAFIIAENGQRSPRVMVFSDFREAPAGKP